MNKTTVSTKDLLTILKKMKGVISKDATLPVLECVLIEVSENHAISIACTNLETHMKCAIPGKATHPIAFTLEYKKLSGLVSNLPNAQISLSYDFTNNTVAVECEGAKYNIASDDQATDFPKFTELSEVLTHRDLTPRMLEDIKMAMGYTSNDCLRPALTAIYFDFKQHEMRIVATDAQALYVSDTYVSIFDERSFAVPCKSMAHIGQICKKEFGEIGFTGEHCFFKNENTIIATRLIDCEYPDYNAVMPLHKSHFSVNRIELIQTIKSMLPVSNFVTKQITFEVNGRLLVEADDIDTATNGSKELSISNPSELNYHFAFNGPLMLRMLSTATSNNINIYSDGDQNKGFIFKAGDEKTTILGLPIMMSA